MGKKRDKRAGYGKILDAWSPPDSAGDPVGCVGTSFTFSPAFFEEECLSRFLRLETDATEDGALYLIEREEKLAQVGCVAALVDQHHCKGKRSVRWDLLSARLPHGILHAKVSVLHWSRLVRIIVASANLTEDGYRRNQEVFGVLDYRAGSDAPRVVLEQIIAFLREAASYNNPGTDAASPALQRWDGFLDNVLQIPGDWGIDEAGRRRHAVRVEAVLTGPTRPSALARLTDVWPPSTPPAYATIVSPFFDPPDAPNRPALELWKRLRQRGEASVEFGVTAEDVPGENAVLVHAPRSLQDAEPTGRQSIYTEFQRLDIDAQRPLHAKTLLIEDDRWAVYMIGSSNFTSAGLGLGIHTNLEANLAYIVDAHQNEAAFNAITAASLTGKPIDLDGDVRWHARDDIGEDSPVDTITLPAAFGAAVYECDEKQNASIKLSLNGDPPAGWEVRTDEDDIAITHESEWGAQGKPQVLTLPWQSIRPPSGLWVKWAKSAAAAWWPVNIASATSLPPPEELRDLPLEVLIEILTSARPLCYVLRKHRSVDGNGSDFKTIIDPHKRVDTSQFLLQRTRRMSWALNALRERLERPAATMECLHWRLHGPVGVAALAKALLREGQSPEEKAFLLSELALELHRVQPQEAHGCVPAKQVRQAILDVVRDLNAKRPKITAGDLDNLRRYVDTVFEVVAT